MTEDGVDDERGARIADVLIPVALDTAYSYQVPEGLCVKEGDVVVTAGVHMLHPGQKVKVLQPQMVVGSAK